MEEEVKVSELPEASSIANDDLFMTIQQGANKKVSTSTLFSNVNTAINNIARSNWGTSEALDDYTGSLNDLTVSGFYPVSSSATSKPDTGEWYVLVMVKNPSTYIKQIAIQRSGNKIFQRQKDNGTWSDWIIEKLGNITTGYEYATGEFIDNKQVYRKRVDLGAFPNNTNKTVFHHISNPKFVRMVIMGDNGSGTYQDMALRGPFECYVTDTALVFNPGGNYSSWTGYADLWYTKS